jgi:hypothetical protein
MVFFKYLLFIPSSVIHHLGHLANSEKPFSPPNTNDGFCHSVWDFVLMQSFDKFHCL